MHFATLVPGFIAICGKKRTAIASSIAGGVAICEQLLPNDFSPTASGAMGFLTG